MSTICGIQEFQAYTYIITHSDAGCVNKREPHLIVGNDERIISNESYHDVRRTWRCRNNNKKYFVKIINKTINFMCNLSLMIIIYRE